MGLHALIVDDDSVDRKMLQRVLSRSGLFSKVTEFENGVDFIEKVSAVADREQSIAFLDLRMPMLSGFDVVERLEAEFGVRYLAGVVIVTTSSAQADIERARRFPSVIRFVSKPIEAHILNSIAECARGRDERDCLSPAATGDCNDR